MVHVCGNGLSDSIGMCWQVLVRLQWVMEVMRGQSTHMEVSLEGLATSVMGGLQDELFNLTLDNLQVSFTVALSSYLPCSALLEALIMVPSLVHLRATT